MDNNEALAQFYDPDVPQNVVVFPIMWRHEAGGGDWYIRYILLDYRDADNFHG